MRSASISQCAILVGGLASRLGSLTASTPKALQDCGGRPFLHWLIREFMRFGFNDFVLLAGHLSDEIEAAAATIRNALPGRVQIRVSVEPFRAGTGGALYHARDLLDPVFILSNGDSLFDCNLATVLAAQALDDDDVLGRMVLREVEDVGRFGIVEMSGERVTAFHERGSGAGSPSEVQGGRINSGLYVLRKRVIEQLAPHCSLEAEILPALASRGTLRGTIGRGWFMDIGVPADLAVAQVAIPARLRRPALFLDRDGVINLDHGWVGTRERFQWSTGALEAIRAATELGWHVFVVTNQSGVARGLYDEAAVHDLHRWILEQVHAAGGTIDDWRYCPFHPEAPLPAYRRASGWRKPSPGMLLDLMDAWELDPATCLMVGDQATDLAAAAAAGIAGHRFAGGDLAAFLMPLLTRHAQEHPVCAPDIKAREEA